MNLGGIRMRLISRDPGRCVRDGACQQPNSNRNGSKEPPGPETAC